MRKLTSTSRCLWLFLPLAFVPSAVAGPIFLPGTVNVSGGSNGNCIGSTSPFGPGATVQASGNYTCANFGFFPFVNNWGGSVAPFLAEIAGTGSGVFDTNFFPAGFTALGAIEGTNTLLPMTATLQINGQTVRIGATQAMWDVGPDLTGMTLSTWKIILRAASQSVSGTGQPPGVLLGNYAYCAWLGTNQLCNTSANNSPANPVLPNSPTLTSPGNGAPPAWIFNNVPGGRWFDPPFVNAFQYAGTSGTKFDKITLPTGYGNAFTIWTGAGFTNNLGAFAGGSLVDFILGGVDSFQIRDINPTVDAALPNAFPLQVFFEGGGNGSFTQTPLEDAVPEPATWMMLALGLPWLLRARRR